MSPERKNLVLYAVKCIAVTAIVFELSDLFHYQNFIWFLVSAILVLTPESKDAVPLAATRIGANLIASAVSLACLLVGPGNYLTLSVALSLTIGLCAVSKLMAGSRSALAAVVIIMLHESGDHFWDAALLRAASVVAGCFLGLVVTFAFHRSLSPKREQPCGDHTE